MRLSSRARPVTVLASACAAIAAALVALPPVSAAPAAGAPVVGGVGDPRDDRAPGALPRCLGRPATIVGTPGARLVGGRGPDVVVTNGARSVRTLAGSDLVCLTGRAVAFPGVTVSTGSGDDRVVNASGTVARADLGLGSDRFRGGPTYDGVTVDDGGADVIRLGAGPDALSTPIGPIAGSAVDGGPGRDSLRVVGARGPLVVLDDARGVVERRGVRRPLRGFDSYEVLGHRGPLSFVGGASDDDLVVQGRFAEISLGGGDDRIRFAEFVSVDGALRGGTGVDVLTADFFYDGARVGADLASGRFAWTLRERSDGFAIGGMNDLRLGGGTVDVTGTDGRDVVTVGGCFGVLDGAGGDDSVAARTETDLGLPFCDGQGFTLRGGAGDDVLTGSASPDVLVGGDGTDLADGGAGDGDVCEAETTVGCESFAPGRSARPRVG